MRALYYYVIPASRTFPESRYRKYYSQVVLYQLLMPRKEYHQLNTFDTLEILFCLEPRLTPYVFGVYIQTGVSPLLALHSSTDAVQRWLRS